MKKANLVRAIMRLYFTKVNAGVDNESAWQAHQEKERRRELAARLFVELMKREGKGSKLVRGVYSAITALESVA